MKILLTTVTITTLLSVTPASAEWFREIIGGNAVIASLDQDKIGVAMVSCDGLLTLKTETGTSVSSMHDTSVHIAVDPPRGVDIVASPATRQQRKYTSIILDESPVSIDDMKRGLSLHAHDGKNWYRFSLRGFTRAFNNAC